MSQAKQGDTVLTHYTGKLEDGTVFDSSTGKEPLRFTIGNEEVIPGYDQAVVGMSPGETKTVTVPPPLAYGGPIDDLIIQVQRSELPPEIQLEVGQKLQMTGPNGVTVPTIILKVTEQVVFLDANHPLAGQDLTFEIELVEIAVAG